MKIAAGINEDIRNYAYDIGFSRVGFISAQEHFTEFEQAIWDSGEHYDWWRDSPREPLAWARPAEKAPWAKSIIILVYNYANIMFPERLTSLMGRVYQSRSYFAPPNNINGARLQLLSQFLDSLDIRNENTDWLPLRWAGVRAGLSSFGKNACAYAPGLGSFILLFAILIDADLEYSEPGPVSTCPDDCTRCIDACPTAALYAPYHLNPRRCIAFNNWMTAADRGHGITTTIPLELRPQLGTRIHGCDACQEACPRNAAVLKNNKSRPHDALLSLLAKELSLEKLLHMPDGYYRTQVRPVMYNYIRDPRLFQRNAAIAMGNSGDQRYIPELQKEQDNPCDFIREHVNWALERLTS
jgi:epoxyqueuosine reductase